MQPKKICDRKPIHEDRSIYIERDQIKSDYELAMRFLNDVVALNYAQRSQIDALRKKRVMNDGIFSTLEQQIHEEERLLIEVLQNIRSNEYALKENTEHFNSINELLERKVDHTFQDLVEEQRKVYQHIKMNQSPTFEVNTSLQVTNNDNQIKTSEKQRMILKKFYQNTRKKEQGTSAGIMEVIKQHKQQERSQKITLLEQLFIDIKLKSEESDLDRLTQTFLTIKEQNECLFQEYQEMEKEVSS